MMRVAIFLSLTQFSATIQSRNNAAIPACFISTAANTQPTFDTTGWSPSSVVFGGVGRHEPFWS